MTIHRICLTGGPSSGKTTSLALITERLKSLGYNVLIVPEAATLFILGGVNLQQNIVQTQTCLAKFIMNLEDYFYELAQASNQKTVILYDRGIMDSKAFITDGQWQAMLDHNNWNVVSLRDKRYDAVIHLTTAAMGEGYTLENNPARSETPEQARNVDLKIREAWVGHPKLKIIENTTEFSDKVRQVMTTICHILGEPEPLEIEKKFLIKSFTFPNDLKYEKIEIRQSYLQSDKGIERIRQRGQNGSNIYFHSLKRKLSAGKNVEVEKMISSHDYLRLFELVDPGKKEIIKSRYCFLWKNRYFELDCFIQPEGLIVLEIEVDDLSEQIELPPFIIIDREVTDEEEYSNYNLANLQS